MTACWFALSKENETTVFRDRRCDEFRTCYIFSIIDRLQNGFHRRSAVTMNSAKKRVLVAMLGFAIAMSPMECFAQEAQKLTLARTVALALENSRALALGRAKINSARNLALVDRAEFQPSLETGSGAGFTYGMPLVINGQAPSLFQLTYTQAIYDPLLRGQIRAEEERVKGGEVDLARTRDEVILRTATSYLELAKIHHLLELLRNERKSAQEILEFTRKRAASGMEFPIEVTRGELAVAKIAQRIAQCQGRSEILAAQLEGLTGAPSAQFDAVSAEDLPSIDRPVDNLVQMALENNPALKAAAIEQDARQKILKGERGGYWPTLAVVGQYNVLSRFNNYDQFFKTFQRNNVSLGVLIRIPVFNSKTSARIALAGSRLSEAELNTGIVRNDERVAAKQEINNLTEKDSVIAVAKLELKLAQESLALIQAKFDNGHASLKELEQARLDEGEKWIAFLEADFAHQQAQLAVMQRTGQLPLVFK
jgi:outer membrane protein